MAIYSVSVDGAVYEADTIDTLAQWTAEGRLGADSVITDTGTGIKFTVGEHPELRTKIPVLKPVPSSPLQTPIAQAQRPLSSATGVSVGASNKMAAGICGILLNCLGIHKFILGYTTEGIIMLLISIIGGVCTCGVATIVMSLIGFIEGIIYLTKSDEEFVQTYVRNKRGWF